LGKPLRYLYFRIYAWNLRAHGSRDYPQYNALLGTSFLMLLNALSVPLLVEALGISVVETSGFRPLAVSLIPFVFFFHYMLLFRGRRYEQIAKEFQGESEESRRRGTLLVWTYILLSFATFFGLAFMIAFARA